MELPKSVSHKSVTKASRVPATGAVLAISQGAGMVYVPEPIRLMLDQSGEAGKAVIGEEE